MRPLFECFIPGRAGIKKNGRKVYRSGFRTFTVPSDRYEAWAHDASFHLRRAARGMEAIQAPVNARMIFFAQNRMNEADLSNLYQGIEDLLQELGILENDKLIYSHDGSRKVFGKQFVEGALVTLTPSKPPVVPAGPWMIELSKS